MSTRTKATEKIGSARTETRRSAIRTLKDRVKRWWERRHIFVGAHALLAVAVFSAILLAPSRALSQPEREPVSEDIVAIELAELGSHGETILRVRSRTLEILQGDNACSQWFRESNPEVSDVFRSIHFELEENGVAAVYGEWNFERGMQYKHPWGARTTENAGRNAIVQLNANGPFFRHASAVIQKGPGNMIPRQAGYVTLYIATYSGNSSEAQITILLHELGHVIGRIPADDDSWDGRSSRNTLEVLRHCKAETKSAARNGF
jgi:hypothetical protein